MGTSRLHGWRDTRKELHGCVGGVGDRKWAVVGVTGRPAQPQRLDSHTSVKGKQEPRLDVSFCRTSVELQFVRPPVSSSRLRRSFPLGPPSSLFLPSSALDILLLLARSGQVRSRHLDQVPLLAQRSGFRGAKPVGWESFLQVDSRRKEGGEAGGVVGGVHWSSSCAQRSKQVGEAVVEVARNII